MINQPPPFNQPEREAWKHLAKSCYVLTDGPKTVKRIEKLYVPKWVKSRPGVLTMIVLKAGIERRIEFKWEF